MKSPWPTPFHRLLSASLVISRCYAATTLDFRRIGETTRSLKVQDLLGVDTLGTSGDGPDDNRIANHADVRYSTNITLGGQWYSVALDTGSTDLWVNPATPERVGDFNSTGIPLQLLYGDGTYGVSGTIAVASFKMGSFNVSEQAFLDVESSSVRGLHELGIDGVLGLSFDLAIASPINQAAKVRDGIDAVWGRSVLGNIFAQNPEEPNFIALDLSRTDDFEDVAGGSFSIGEYAGSWAAIEQAPKLAQFPKGSYRWTTLLEGVSVGGTRLNLTSQIRGAPNGTLVVLLDSGDPTAAVPVKLQNDIYSRIPGAVSFRQQGNMVWIIPCNTTTVVELSFGGDTFPIHPLDLSILSPVTISGKQYTACARSIAGVDNLGGIEFDASLGDIIMRNVYSVFDFGDARTNGTMGEPYMQLLAQTNSTASVAQVTAIRGRTMAAMPPELPPAELVDLLRAADPTIETSESAPTNACTVGPNASSMLIEEVERRDLSPEAESLPTTNRYGPVIVGLLGANLVVGLTVLALGVFSYVRRGKVVRHLTRSGPHYVTASHGLEGSRLIARSRVYEEISNPSNPSLHA